MMVSNFKKNFYENNSNFRNPSSNPLQRPKRGDLEPDIDKKMPLLIF